MGKQLLRRPVLIALIALTAACTVQQTNVPSVTGPSEFGLAVTVAAQPDIITRDGISQSTITITARDPNGSPVAGTQFRVDMGRFISPPTLPGVPPLPASLVRGDFGSLSSRFVFSGSDGRATLRYTSPPPPVPGTDEPGDGVTIIVEPVDSNYQTANAQTAEIRLVVPPTDIGGNAPFPQFTFAPANPSAGELIVFDARASVAPTGRTITKFSWSWGDGETATGITEDHDYTNAGTFIVTLTVTDSAGVSASTSKTIAVTAS
jgi:hypothetical protein